MKATLTKITSTPTKLNSKGEVTAEAQAKIELVFDLADDTEREGIKQLHDALDTGNIEIYIQVLPQHFNPSRRDESFPIVDDRGQFFLQYGEKTIKEDSEQMDLITDDSLMDADEAFRGIRTVAEGETEQYADIDEMVKPPVYPNSERKIEGGTPSIDGDNLQDKNRVISWRGTPPIEDGGNTIDHDGNLVDKDGKILVKVIDRKNMLPAAVSKD